MPAFATSAAICCFMPATTVAACAACPVASPICWICAYAPSSVATAGSISTGTPSLVIPETRPLEFCEATTRLGLYLAIASMLGVRPVRLVFGTPAG